MRGHLEPFCMFIFTSKTNFMFSNSTRGCLQADDVSIKYVIALVLVLLTESVFM